MDQAQPEIPCAKCSQPLATIRKMTVTYETSIDLETNETVHHRVGITYGVECPDCGHSFSVTERQASSLPRPAIKL
jgi:ribosomal protein S27E